MSNQLRKSYSYKKSNGWGHPILFLASDEEDVSSNRNAVIIKNISNQFKRNNSIRLALQGWENEIKVSWKQDRVQFCLLTDGLLKILALAKDVKVEVHISEFHKRRYRIKIF